MVKKNIYTCISCNTILKKKAGEEAPVCCGREMEVMDEIEEEE